MTYPKEFENVLAKARELTGMSLADFNTETDKLKTLAHSLVQERIQGGRKGLPDELNYMHSVRVNETVSSLHHGDDPDIEMFIAALLHDIVEDGNTSIEELVEMGFTRRIVELVYLCSHDTQIEDKTERWMLMMAKLTEARDEEAWCIKLIDLSDNLKQSHGLTEENRKFMVEVKAPLMLRLTKWLDNGFSRRYRHHLEETLEVVSGTK